MNIRALASVVFCFCSSLSFATPQVLSVKSDGNVIWTQGQTAPLKLKSGQWITIEGQGFGERGQEDGRSSDSLSTIFWQSDVWIRSRPGAKSTDV